MRNEWGRCDGDECGALHRYEGYSEKEEMRTHECQGCGLYVPGALTFEGGLCPRCFVVEHREEAEALLDQPPRSDPEEWWRVELRRQIGG